MKKTIAFIAMSLIGLMLIGCGGGDGDSSSSGSTTPAATTLTGTFVDAPVEGLAYSTPTLSGYTNSKGEYQYKTGETITFKIGNLELGSVVGGNLITPLTLTGESNLSNISVKATNIARILQTLDENSSNQGVIKIPVLLRDLNVSNINLALEADLNTVLVHANSITSTTYVLKDPVLAKSSMVKYINAYTNYPLINSLTYTSTGTKYYLLALLQESNVLMSHYGRNSFETGMALGGNRISIYDLDLNATTEHNGKLYAGTYIIKVDHDTTNSTFLINYPELINQTTHTKLINGTYTATGMKYYSLHMPSNGNIQFTFDAGLAGHSYPSYIYDNNLTFIGSAIGTLNLTAGDYVIFFDHGATDQAGKNLTVQSAVLN
jgi:hypothetical protein